jgi:hypothetical protein
MKELKIILVVLLIILPVFGVYRYTESQAPEWTAQARIKTEIAQQTAPTVARQEIERAELWTGFYRGLMAAIIVGLFVTIGVLSWKQYDQRKESWARAVDGSFVLSTFKNAQGQIWTVDPNKQTFGAIGFSKSSGELITDAALVGADRQLSYVQAIQRTRTAQATAISEIRTSAQAKYASGYYDRPQQPAEYRAIEDEPEQLTVAPWQPLTLADAFAQSTADRWLLGQNEQGACEFNIGSIVHAAILGSSNSGKSSSTGLLMAANARRQGMNVIALDAANGIDWNPYSDTFEVYETDHRVIGDQLNQIIKIHEGRKKACVLGGVKTIYQLDYTLPPMLIVMEEFGRLLQSFKNVDPDNYENIVVALTVLMSDSRKSGISFLFIDQGMQVWDKRFKTNIRDYIAYKMNARQGSAFDAYDLHKLKPQGQFWRGGEIYDAWHTAPQFNILQKELQPQRVKLLTDSQAVTTVTDNRDGGYLNGKNTVYTPPITVTSKSDNTRVTTDKTGDNEGDNDNAVTSNVISNNNAVTTSVTTPLSLSGPAVTTKEKQEVYRIYQSLGKRKNATAKIIWGNAGGYLKYLNAVIAEYEGGETLQ